ncbi:hypothetical protein J4037_13005 [Cellulomonas sp. zg-ZUI168]|nr:hypothetical protein [Cellulomonas fengjieae]
MTLGDTTNGLMMLKMYGAAQADPRRRINYNLLVTGIVSGLVVGVVALSAILAEAGARIGPVAAIASLDTQYAGYLLAALFAVIGVSAWLLWRGTARLPGGA